MFVFYWWSLWIHIMECIISDKVVAHIVNVGWPLPNLGRTEQCVFLVLLHPVATLHSDKPLPNIVQLI